MRQRRQDLHEGARRHRRRQEDRDHPQGRRRHRRPTSPSAWRRSWWCATRSTSSPASLLTPNALAAADVSAEAKKFMVVMNAATSIITTKSPYMVRTSVTMPQVDRDLGTWAVQERRAQEAYTMVTDYGPGHDGEAAFQRPSRRPAARSSARCASRWRTRTSRPSCSAPRTSTRKRSTIFVPGGAQPAALGKAFAERGIDRTRSRSWARRD